MCDMVKKGHAYLYRSCFKDQRIVSNLHHSGDKDLQVRVMNGEFHIVFIGRPGATSLWRQMVRLAVSS